MSNLITRKEVAPAKDSNLLTKQSDRNKHLANQIFNDFDYAKDYSKSQYICRNCGKSISRDTAVFNKSVCGACQAKTNVELSTTELLKPKGRQIKVTPCSDCQFVFAGVRKRGDLCLQCAGKNNEFGPAKVPIEIVLNNFINGHISGGMYAS